PASFSLVAATLEANRYSMGVGVQMVIKRLPIMIAPILGGMLIDRFGVVGGVRIALLVSIFLSAATIFVQRRLREEPNNTARSTATAQTVEGGHEPGTPKPERWNFWRSLLEFNAPMRRL